MISFFIFILHRFSSVAKEVLAHKIPSKAYDCYMLLCDAVQMLYSKQLQAEGWQNNHIARLEKLLWTHAIRAEEFYGLQMCTENLEYSVHAAEDIRRHSSMDNYSCELYERAILRHKGQKHNAKGIEKTCETFSTTTKKEKAHFPSMVLMKGNTNSTCEKLLCQ